MKMTNSYDISASAQQRNIERAAAAKNPMETLPNVTQFSGDDAIMLYCRRKGDMDSKTLKWAFKLAEKNVSPFYKELKMGWQPKVKQNDMNKNWARYLVALDSKQTPIAYAMFRFDLDYSHSVLYCYEMHIESSYQRHGLGKFMMEALEKCALHWQMEKIVLTVLKNNANAMTFFRTIGYNLDDSSPDVLENAEYVILSKSPIIK